MKSVSVKKYNLQYFSHIDYIDYLKPVKTSDFKFIHRYLASLVKFSKDDFLVDFGCGTGDLVFLLAMKYKCRLLGIDYSKDAVKIAKENLSLLQKTKSLFQPRVQFLNVPNERLPKLKDVTCIYMADVIEHLFGKEVDFVLRKFITWNNSKLQLITHTDNNNYLIYVRPIVDLINLIARKSTIRQIRERNNWEKERHINLTTPNKLRNILKKYGFIVRKVEYSPLFRERIQIHLGNSFISKILLPFIYITGKTLSFLLPSFYMVLEKKRKTT